VLKGIARIASASKPTLRNMALIVTTVGQNRVKPFDCFIALARELPEGRRWRE